MAVVAKCHPQYTANGLWWDCPGCGLVHWVNLDPAATRERADGTREPAPCWSWNGSLDAPTFSPSVLVTWTAGDQPRVCHMFVQDGRVQFLGDCTHALAGHTVDLSPIEEDRRVN
jgi:hypothetical protein